MAVSEPIYQLTAEERAQAIERAERLHERLQQRHEQHGGKA